MKNRDFVYGTYETRSSVRRVVSNIYARDAETAAQASPHDPRSSTNSAETFEHQHDTNLPPQDTLALSCISSPTSSAENISSPSFASQPSVSDTSAPSTSDSPSSSLCSAVHGSDDEASEAQIESDLTIGGDMNAPSVMSLRQESGELDLLAMVNWLLSRQSREGTRWKQLAENRAMIRRMRNEPFNFRRLHRRRNKEAAAGDTRLHNKDLYRPRSKALDLRGEKSRVTNWYSEGEAADSYEPDADRSSGVM